MATSTQDNVTYNTDIDGLIRRIDRAIVEVVKSQSSGVSQTISFDVVRTRSYIAGIRAYIEYIVAQPTMDLPETGPRAVQLPNKPTIPLMENESLRDMATMLDLMRDEMSASQSSRLSSNLISHDLVRATSYLLRMDKFLTDYITVIDPLDLPESSPMSPITGAGIGGV